MAEQKNYEAPTDPVEDDDDDDITEEEAREIYEEMMSKVGKRNG